MGEAKIFIECDNSKSKVNIDNFVVRVVHEAKIRTSRGETTHYDYVIGKMFPGLKSGKSCMDSDMRQINLRLTNDCHPTTTGSIIKF